MRLGHLELPVADPVASGRFYVETLGFELVAVQRGRFVWVRLGDAEILLRPGPPRPPGTAEATPNLVLYSDAVDAAVARLRGRGLEPTLRGTCWHFQDPDGHWFQLVDPMVDHGV